MSALSATRQEESIRVLLVDPKPSSCPRGQDLHETRFSVALACSGRDALLLCSSCTFDVALISDSLGPTLLRQVSVLVRRTWPSARILILGAAPSLFEDHLYDDSAPHTADRNTFLITVEKLLNESWHRSGIAAYSLKGQHRTRSYGPP